MSACVSSMPCSEHSVYDVRRRPAYTSRIVVSRAIRGVDACIRTCARVHAIKGFVVCMPICRGALVRVACLQCECGGGGGSETINTIAHAGTWMWAHV